MAGRKSLLSFGFSSNRAQQAASAGNSGSLPLDPAPNSEPGEIPGLEGSKSPSGPSEQPSGQLDQPDSSPSHLESEQQSQQQLDDFLIDAPGQCLISGREQSMPNIVTLVKAGLVSPLNIACVERGFSHHGIIKNKLRSRLKVVNVDSLLRVKLLCRDYKKFD